MSVRSLNKVMLIGNLTRDPELRYTPNGTAVVSFGLATNRSWTTEAGEKKEDAEFHKIVAWNKLAELCSQLLAKGRKIFVEGRLQTRTWQGADGQQRTTTEIVIDDMIILDSRRPEVGTHEMPGAGGQFAPSAIQQPAAVTTSQPAATVRGDEPVAKPQAAEKKPEEVKPKTEAKKIADKEVPNEDINPDDIPF